MTNGVVGPRRRRPPTPTDAATMTVTVTAIDIGKTTTITIIIKATAHHHLHVTATVTVTAHMRPNRRPLRHRTGTTPGAQLDTQKRRMRPIDGSLTTATAVIITRGGTHRHRHHPCLHHRS